MKNLFSHVRFRMVLPLLFLAVLLTLPTASTGSKYVWNNTIDITLEIVVEKNITIDGVNGSGKNSLAIYPSVYWAQELEHMEAEATKEGLVLTVEDGYTLPESITVTIGQASFLVRTDGTEPLEGITFDAASGLLSISESLIAESYGEVTVRAAAVSEDVPGDETPAGETPPDSEAPPAGETPPDSEAPPASETPPDSEAPPASETPPDSEAPPASETPPDSEALPASETPPDSEALPASEGISDDESTIISEISPSI